MIEEKPPIGITPHWLHEEIRIKELLKAMIRFVEQGKPFPLEWVEELSDYACRKAATHD